MIGKIDARRRLDVDTSAVRRVFDADTLGEREVGAFVQDLDSKLDYKQVDLSSIGAGQQYLPVRSFLSPAPRVARLRGAAAAPLREKRF